MNIRIASAAGSLVISGLLAFCLVLAIGWVAYEWITTGGHLADAGHPPSSYYVLSTVIIGITALAPVSLVLGLVALRSIPEHVGSHWKKRVLWSVAVSSALLLASGLAWLSSL